ncbi:MAG: prepilin-type N-terminal cleavage/methylation domain-containing protein [Planctomycetes bacterium]|nr:prepilin-type N-terminal cleavage/methylation domain-containing protein [Planctomycetota bacterium]
MRKGFTLLEILVALMILAIGLASVFALFGAGTSSYRRSVNDATVARMATTMLAEIETSLQNLPPGNIPLRDATNKTHPDFPSIYTYDLTLTPITDSANDSVFVTLTIKWKQPKGFGSEKFETIIRINK